MVEFRMDSWQDLSTDNSPLGSRWIIYLAAFNSCHDRIHVDQAFSRLDCAQVSLSCQLTEVVLDIVFVTIGNPIHPPSLGLILELREMRGQKLQLPCQIWGFTLR
jgi:hypothetical protein